MREIRLSGLDGEGRELTFLIHILTQPVHGTDARPMLEVEASMNRRVGGAVLCKPTATERIGISAAFLDSEQEQIDSQSVYDFRLVCRSK